MPEPLAVADRSTGETAAPHVMAELQGVAHEEWHRTVFARASHTVRRST